MDTCLNRFLLLIKPTNFVLILSLSVGSLLLIREIGAASLATFSFQSEPLKPLENMLRNIFADEWESQAWKIAIGISVAFWAYAGKQLRNADRILCKRHRGRLR
jgi:hypothetical protein